MNTAEALDLIRKHFEAKNGPLILNAQNEQAAYTIAAWVAREPRQGMDPGKGLLIMGNVGTGKTELMRAASQAYRDIHGIGFGVKPCSDLARDYTPKDTGGAGTLSRWIEGPHVCFDDLGTEPSDVQHMGNHSNVMAEVIEARYSRYTNARVGSITHLTTNLSVQEIADRYGPRAASRLRHMVNTVNLGANAGAMDFRKSAAPPVQPEPSEVSNIYEAGNIHPDIIKRLRTALGHAPKLTEMKVVRSATREEQIAAFAEDMRNLDREQLETMGQTLADNYASNPEVSKPYLDAIAKELESRPKVA